MTMIPHNLIWEMMMAYEGGLSLSALSRRFGKNRKTIGEAFSLRGFKLQPPPPMPTLDPKTGCFVPVKPKTAREIETIIAGMKRICCPPALKQEWRSWTMSRRVEFIRRARAKLARENGGQGTDRPTTPFSSNVTPWEYGTAAVMELAYDGASQMAGHKLKLTSQGVIWRGVLFYWVRRTGYVEGVPWRPETGRAMLGHVIWEHHHRRPVPPGHVVIQLDGNKNNFEPRNLALRTKNDICRINQAAAVKRKSRELTGVLLHNHQSAAAPGGARADKKQNANHSLISKIAAGCYRGSAAH